MDVREFLELARVELVPVTAKEAETALAAFARYGKGRGHPGQLNLGDCFAYAVARNYRTFCSPAKISTRLISAQLATADRNVSDIRSHFECG